MNLLKNLIGIFLFGFLFWSCSSDTKFEAEELGEIVSADLPEELVIGQTYQIPITFRIKTSCHRFLEFSIDDEITDQTQDRRFYLGVVILQDGLDCEEFDNEFETRDFTFEAIDNGHEEYEFFFYQGVSNQGSNLYLRQTVPLVSE